MTTPTDLPELPDPDFTLADAVKTKLMHLDQANMWLSTALMSPLANNGHDYIYNGMPLIKVIRECINFLADIRTVVNEAREDHGDFNPFTDGEHHPVHAGKMFINAELAARFKRDHPDQKHYAHYQVVY